MMKLRKANFHPTYPALILVLLLMLWLSQNVGAIAEFSLNLSTEIIGIILTIVLVDSVFRRQRKRELEQYETVALRQLWKPLNTQIQLFQKVYKASVSTKPEILHATIEDFLNDDDFYSTLIEFDDTKRAPVSPGRSWRDHLVQEALVFEQKLDRVADKYAPFLSHEILNIIEQVAGSWYLEWIRLRPSREQSRSDYGDSTQNPLFPVVINEGVEESATMVREYAQLLLKLISFYNAKVPREEKISLKQKLWSNNMAPHIGSARYDS